MKEERDDESKSEKEARMKVSQVFIMFDFRKISKQRTY